MSTARFELAEAQAVLPEARRHLAEAVAPVAELRELLVRLRQGPARPELTARVARLREEADAALWWFAQRGIQIKSLEPALLDFPARAVRDGRNIDVLLCWRDDEETIGYYHPPELGYRGREPVALLDRV